MEDGRGKFGGVSLGFSLSIQNPSDHSGGNDVDITETDSPIHKSKTPIGRAASGDSIDAINVVIEDGSAEIGSPIYTPKLQKINVCLFQIHLHAIELASILKNQLR